MESKVVTLPYDLIIQILMRLPVKSLLRFKCVCKSWLSLISDPHFALSHFDLAASPTYRLLYIPNCAHASQTRSIDLDAPSFHRDDYDSVSSVLNLSFITSYSFNIMGSCRGFILLLLPVPSSLFLWNPSTGFNKSLALSSNNESKEDAIFVRFLYGFGYDPSTDDYLVVSASYNPDPEADLETFFELFSVKANAWNRIEGMNLPYMNASDDPRAGTLLNGVIHWLAFHYDVENVIVAFDLTERSFSEVLLPADLNQELKFCDLCVLGGGLLCLCEMGGARTETWVMEEYKVQSSWTKSIVVSFDDIPSLYFSPVCSTKSGDIVGIDDSTVLVKCNAEGQILEQRSYSDDPHGCEVVMYTESLLSLPIEIGQAAGGDV